MKNDYCVLVSTADSRKDFHGQRSYKVTDKFDGFSLERAEAIVLAVNGRMTYSNRIDVMPSDTVLEVGGTFRA